MANFNGVEFCEGCLATLGETGECLCLVERMVEVSSNKEWGGFHILGGSESFEAAIEDLDGDLELAEEDAWMSEAEDIPVSAEEVVSKIRLALGRESGGGACGRGDRSGGCSGCTCGKNQ